jgi:tryptophan synthase beta chain
MKKTILFNLCGRGYFDMQAYDDYLSGKLVGQEVTKEEIDESLEEIAALQVS